MSRGLGTPVNNYFPLRTTVPQMLGSFPNKTDLAGLRPVRGLNIVIFSWVGFQLGIEFLCPLQLCCCLRPVALPGQCNGQLIMARCEVGSELERALELRNRSLQVAGIEHPFARVRGKGRTLQSDLLLDQGVTQLALSISTSRVTHLTKHGSQCGVRAGKCWLQSNRFTQCIGCLRKLIHLFQNCSQRVI